MTNIQFFFDKTAIVLSLLCAIHCLIMPLLLILLPSALSLQLGENNETFHFWLLFAVIPISIFALTKGCKKHQNLHLLAGGSLGLAFMILAVFLPKPLIGGEMGEKGLTLLGALIIAFAHLKNYRACRKSACDCAT